MWVLRTIAPGIARASRFPGKAAIRTCLESACCVWVRPQLERPFGVPKFTVLTNQPARYIPGKRGKDSVKEMMPNNSCTSLRPIKKVLLTTDFSAASTAAFDEALRLCRASGASLFILNVFEYASICPSDVGGHMIELDSFYADAEESIHALVQEARAADVQCEGQMLSGIAHAEILGLLSSHEFDLTVLGTRAIHGFERLVFGSTAEAVLRKANCPVLTVGPLAAARVPHQDGTGGIVLFATDFHVTTTEALCYAATYAAAMQMPLHCVNVLPRGVEDVGHRGVIPLIITEALQHLAVTFDHELPSPVCAVTFGSEISVAIVEYARKHDARMIVLGVRRASLLASHVPAHITYRIITEAPCPVLTIAFPIVPDQVEPALACAGEVDQAEPALTGMLQ